MTPKQRKVGRRQPERVAERLSQHIKRKAKTTYKRRHQNVNREPKKKGLEVQSSLSSEKMDTSEIIIPTHSPEKPPQSSSLHSPTPLPSPPAITLVPRIGPKRKYS